MLKKIKGWGRKHPKLLIVSAILASALAVVLCWPREFIINGQVGASLKGQTVDLRLMRFSNQTSGRLLEAVDYNNVRTTKDGRFSLVHRAPLWRLPTISYLQICIKSAEQQASWDETLPVCAETPELSYPATTNVKGASDGTSAVSCSRRQITGGLPGAIGALLSLTSNTYEFSLYCDRVYHNIGIAALEEVETYVNPVLVLSGNELSINGSGGVVLPLAEPQELKLDDNVLSISGGNSVVLPAGSVQMVSEPDTNQWTITPGDGLSGGGTAELGGSLTLSSVLGSTIDSAEIVNGSVAFADLSDNGCASGEVAQWNGSAWVCSAAGVDTDDQTLSLAANILSIDNGNSVNLASYLDNTDAQTLSFNTGTSILSISGGNSADLSSLLDDTDTLADLSCAGGEIAKWNGAAWLCAADNVNDADASPTNELQNLFLTVDAPSGTDPVADSTTDTLALADGAGITITGDAGTDTITIAAVLGSSIESSEITNGTITSDDLGTDSVGTDEIINGTVANADLTNSSLTVTAGTGLSGGGVVSLGSSVVLNAVLGTAVDTSEITDGTILFADVNANGCNAGEIFEYDGANWICGTDNNSSQNLFETIAVPNGTNPVADSTTDTLTLAEGAGLTITGNGATDTVTLAAVLGASIESSEVTDGTLTSDDLGTNSVGSDEIGADAVGTSEIATGGVATSEILNATILFEDIAQNTCSSGETIEWNGSAWICGTDSDTSQNVFSTIDAPNGTDAIADSASDTLTLAQGAGVTITGDGSTDTITIAAVLGATIESSEITDGTVTSDDLGTNSVGSDEIATGAVTTDEILNGTIAAADVAGNVFVEIGRASAQTDSGTNSTIFINKTGASGNLIELEAGGSDEFVVGFNGIITTASVDGGSIVNGSVANADLANSSLTVTSGSGLTGGGSVALGGSTTINIGAGNGIVVNADDITVQVAASTDGLSSTTSSGSGLEVLSAGVALLQGCANNDILKWNETTDVWACTADNVDDGDTSPTNELQNIFLTIDTPNGTDPVADSTTDTLTLAAGAGVTITGDSGTDTITLAAVLGNSVESSEITDGTITSDDLGTDSVGADEIASGVVGTDEITNATITATDVAGNVFVEIGRATAQTDGGTNRTIFINKTGASGNLVELEVGGSDEFVVGFDGIISSASVDSTSIINGSVANADLANSGLTLTSGSGLTGGGSVSLGGTTTINIGAGAGITVNADDVAVDLLGSADAHSSTTSSGSGMETVSAGLGLLQGCADNEILKWDETNDVWECSADAAGSAGNIFGTIDAPNGTDPVADSSTDTLVLAEGAGVTITGDSSTDTITLASVIGATVESSEITNGTITSDDLGTDSVGTDEIINGTVANADLANSSLTVTAGSGLSSGGSVSLGGTTTLNIGAGNGITVNADDITIDALGSADGLSTTTSSGSGLEVLASGVGLLQGCANNDILRWNEGSDVWECFADADTSASNELQNLFLTFDAPSGSDPVADSTTDTLTLAAGAGVTITGDSGTDTLTLAAVLGATIDSSEITDGTITSDDLGTDSVGTDEIANGTVANADLANSALTVTSGSGLTGGGSVALGGSTTINIGAGNGITVNADDITIDLLGATDGLSSTTSSGSGLETVSAGLGLLQGCADNDILKWDETSDIWECSSDLSAGGNIFETINAPSGTDPVADSATDTLNLTAGTGLTITGTSGTDTIDFAVTADGLNFSELTDSLSLDAATTIALGANALTINLDSSGDFLIQDNGTTVMTILDNGSITIGDSAIDQAIGIDNGTGTINIATDGDANTTNIGTGSGADTVTIGDSNANVAITDAQWSISATGAASFATLSGAGLADCDSSTSKLLWDSTTSQFSCGTDRASFQNVLNGNYTNTTTSMTDVDNDSDAADDLGFAIGANEVWIFSIDIQFNSPAAADSQWQVTAPGGATCDIAVNDLVAATISNLACGATSGNVATQGADDGFSVYGSVTNGGTAGNVQLQFRQVAASGTSTIYAGSSIVAFRLDGADYAETYYSTDFSIGAGLIVELSGDGPSQVKKANNQYSDRQVGIVSTAPAQVIGAADGTGKPLPVALSGRVPVKLTTENGLPSAGDHVTASASRPGYGMKATRSGHVVGQLMVDAADNGDGTADGFVYVRHGYWQAPVSVDLSGILNDLTDSTAVLNDELGSLGLGEVAGATFSPLDQTVVDEILRGFSFQQDQIDELGQRVAALEASQQSLSQPDSSVDWSELDNVLVESSLTVVGELVAAGVLKVEGDAFISGHLYLNGDSAGRVVVRSGEVAASVSFSRAYDSQPVVTVSPYSLTDIGYRVKDISRHGFTVELARPPDTDLEFGWQVTVTKVD